MSVTDRQTCVVFGLGVALLAVAVATLALAIHVLLDDAPWQHRKPVVKTLSRYAESWPLGDDGGW